MKNEAAPGPSVDAETADATRRTRLANERTFLAWWRTALTAFAVSFGAGKVVPYLAGGERWPYSVVGAGYAVVGVFFLVYGLGRQRAVESALEHGRFAAPERRVLVLVTLLGIALGLLTLALVVFSP